MEENPSLAGSHERSKAWRFWSRHVQSRRVTSRDISRRSVETRRVLEMVSPSRWGGNMTSYDTSCLPLRPTVRGEERTRGSMRDIHLTKENKDGTRVFVTVDKAKIKTVIGYGIGMGKPYETNGLSDCVGSNQDVIATSPYPNQPDTRGKHVRADIIDLNSKNSTPVSLPRGTRRPPGNIAPTHEIDSWTPRARKECGKWWLLQSVTVSAFLIAVRLRNDAATACEVGAGTDSGKEDVVFEWGVWSKKRGRKREVKDVVEIGVERTREEGDEGEKRIRM
ncbi:hypothetical protein RRG08_049080 [Elysia crispata]|uniref:Uncharacterized protein n=1 Tax=Elysia crispata TaxID=231223 RepID=A0AAE1DVK2_9GAST|nr:hypothetical protein RRG08_049080 [Elysia crispata]